MDEFRGNIDRESFRMLPTNNRDQNGKVFDMSPEITMSRNPSLSGCSTPVRGGVPILLHPGVGWTGVEHFRILRFGLLHPGPGWRKIMLHPGVGWTGVDFPSHFKIQSETPNLGNLWVKSTMAVGEPVLITPHFSFSDFSGTCFRR